MRHFHLWRVAAAAACMGVYPAEPAIAGRTVVDGGATFTLSGYCSPQSANTPDCAPYTLPTAIQLGANTYTSFWVNSNGTVSLGSIESFLGPQNTSSPPPPQGSLSDYSPTPIFSPAFADGQGYFDFTTSNYDGNYVAQTSLTASGFTVNWFFCTDPLACGPMTVDLITNATFSQQSFDAFGLSFLVAQSSQLNDPSATDEQNFESGRQFLLNSYPTTLPVYTMALTAQANGFQVDYLYNLAATGELGTYGFNLPGAQLQNFGPLENRTFNFDSNGALIGSVPEPSTWMSLLLGFGLIGFTLRRQRRLQALA